MEELKLILDAVGKLSGDAQTVAIIYFCYKGILTLTAQCLGLGVIIVLYKILRRTVDNVSKISQVAAVWGFTTPLSDKETMKILACCPKNKE